MSVLIVLCGSGGDKWCIYPMYDYAHGESDFDRRISLDLHTRIRDRHAASTTGICRHRIYQPQQSSSARLNAHDTVAQQRKPAKLVQEKHSAAGTTADADDLRVRTSRVPRRRCGSSATIGVSKFNARIDVSGSEDPSAKPEHEGEPRDGCASPAQVVIENYRGADRRTRTLINNPEDPTAGTRKVPFSRCCTSSRRLPRNPSNTSSPCSRPRGCGCRMPTVVTCRASENDAARTWLW